MPVIYVTSDRSRAGKTAVSVGLSQSLKDSDTSFSLLKPLVIREHTHFGQNDINILKKMNNPHVSQELNWPVILTSDAEQYEKSLSEGIKVVSEYSNGSEFSILEGLSGLGGDSGQISKRLVEELGAKVLVVIGQGIDLGLAASIEAASLYGDKLFGVIINAVSKYKLRELKQNVVPKIEDQGIQVLGVIPEERVLLGTTVQQIADHISGEIINSEEKKDNFVDNYLIGGMVLDWGVFYFERHQNKAVIVRGDRPDIQMAALKTATSCLILTGGHDPIQYVEYEASEEEIPIIKVSTDTLETTTVLETLQDESMFDHPVKYKHFNNLLAKNCDPTRLGELLGI